MNETSFTIRRKWKPGDRGNLEYVRVLRPISYWPVGERRKLWRARVVPRLNVGVLMSEMQNDTCDEIPKKIS